MESYDERIKTDLGEEIDSLREDRRRIRRELLELVPEVPGQPERHITITRSAWVVIVDRICPE